MTDWAPFGARTRPEDARLAPVPVVVIKSASAIVATPPGQQLFAFNERRLAWRILNTDLANTLWVGSRDIGAGAALSKDNGIRIPPSGMLDSPVADGAATAEVWVVTNGGAPLVEALEWVRS